MVRFAALSTLLLLLQASADPPCPDGECPADNILLSLKTQVGKSTHEAKLEDQDGKPKKKTDARTSTLEQIGEAKAKTAGTAELMEEGEAELFEDADGKLKEAKAKTAGAAELLEDEEEADNGKQKKEAKKETPVWKWGRYKRSFDNPPSESNDVPCFKDCREVKAFCARTAYNNNWSREKAEEKCIKPWSTCTKNCDVYVAVDGCDNKGKELDDRVVAADSESKAMVRCCYSSETSCTSLCVGAKTFAEATAFCEEEEGRRLCTVEEMNSRLCCKAGCGHDSELAWVTPR